MFVYQLMVSDLIKCRNTALSVYKNAEKASTIAEDMNTDFIRNGTQKIAYIELRKLYED